MIQSRRIMVFVAMVVSILLVSLSMVGGSSMSGNATSEIFGYASVGDSNKETFGGIYLSNFTSPSRFGTISQISVYLATGGTSAKTVIYSDNNGKPGSLLAASAEVYQSGTSGRWVDFPVSYTGTPNTVYWLGVLFSNAGTYYFATGVSDKAIYFTTQPTATNTFPLGSYSPSRQLSIYATFTSSPTSPSQPVEWVPKLLYVIVIMGLIIAAVLAILLVNARKKERNRDK
jgi:hypothetical protein